MNSIIINSALYKRQLQELVHISGDEAMKFAKLEQMFESYLIKSEPNMSFEEETDDQVGLSMLKSAIVKLLNKTQMLSDQQNMTMHENLHRLWETVEELKSG